MKIDCVFTSEWDGGTEVNTPAFVDSLTGIVDTEAIEVEGLGLEVCDAEWISLDIATETFTFSTEFNDDGLTGIAEVELSKFHDLLNTYGITEKPMPFTAVVNRIFVESMMKIDVDYSETIDDDTDSADPVSMEARLNRPLSENELFTCRDYVMSESNNDGQTGDEFDTFFGQQLPALLDLHGSIVLAWYE